MKYAKTPPYQYELISTVRLVCRFMAKFSTPSCGHFFTLLKSLCGCVHSLVLSNENLLCVCVCVFGKGRWGGSSNFVGIAHGAFTIVFCPSRFSHSKCYLSCWLDASLSWLRNCIIFLMSLQLWNCGASLIWHVWPLVLSLNMRFFQLKFSLKSGLACLSYVKSWYLSVNYHFISK